ncbi:SDR family NAD(P)-dependent oxidoreductase [Micromonospora sp. WMMC241]|uniref:type I polyketide synthase n=1 Tax=Micromonospora sp. WMMC241 TaxID=3015159 RepID=UPI0022B626A8|nr:type I polyketide synthase [Micromonospora sp. WMMC241]MCZ7438227.1 SDR family NAD(P)-dependent oxidoreductase [Micromonospora sp. WMMC241]
MSENRSPDNDPVAVVGLACRLPGAASPDAFWHLLRDGVDAVREAPPDRWPAGPDRPRGGWLDEVDRFDAGFFDIAPREAAAMDPQQRLVLELSWEALERAGIPAAELRGSATAVFAGATSGDYATIAQRGGGTPIGQHTTTGLNRGLIANRVSYALRFTGPSVTVDAGQASSLVAVHLAAQSLRSGEATVALAAGVQLNLAPESTLALSAFGALSPDQRCAVFDASANGIVRGEGAVVLVLKPLAAALADGDTVHCVIRGSAVNHDGGGDSLVTPVEEAQARVLRAAYRRSGLAPEQVRYVELHGTGTALGDPIEAAALGTVLGAGRTGEPLRVGSVKTNIGHLEAAAGIAGLLKTVLAISHRELPPSLHFTAPPASIPLERLGLRVQTEHGGWPGAGPLVAGVSSFGMGGANCHVVLAEGPTADGDAAVPAPSADGAAAALVPWMVSARTPEALREQAARLAAGVDPADSDVAIARALVRTRTGFEHRAAVLGRDRAELRDGLTALASGLPATGVVTGTARPGRIVFVFSGEGSQWLGMARALLDQSPVFAREFEACDRALRPYVDWSLRDVALGVEGAPPADRLDVLQPYLFAVRAALAAMWRAHGVEPAATAGSSQGEVTAAYVAGGLTLDDACRVIALRSLIYTRLVGRGGMVALTLTRDEVRELIAGWDGRIEIAAVNGSRAVVVGGANDALDELVAHCVAHDIQATRVRAGFASHTAQVDECRDELLDALADLRPRTGTVPFWSTALDRWVDTAELDADYWYDNVRRTVELEAAVRGLAADGFRFFVEVSPHPTLVHSVRDTAADAGLDLVAVPTLRRDDGGLDRFVTSVATLAAAGAEPDWASVLGAPVGPRVALPTYAFQRSRFWITDDPATLPAPPSRRAAATPLSADPLVLVRAHAAAILGHAGPDDVDADRTFRGLGFDSLTAVELRNQLVAATGVELDTTALYDHPTPRRLAAHLGSRAAGAGDDVRPVTATVAAGSEPIAVVGIGCRYAGDVHGPAEFWRLVAGGVDAVTGLPADRGWTVDLASGAAGGFLTDAADFDAAFFGISPREALAMDPQQRVLLETAWEALEHARLDPRSLRGTPTGVFVGAMAQEYGPRLHEASGAVEGQVLTGTTISVASGRIAYTLGLEGPAMTVDTACSSSLVALHLAGQALRSGECDLALAGGVTVMSTPGIFTEFSRQGGLAPDGRCKAFADAADGTGWGEGAGVLVLERLADARRNGHEVLAVLRGTAVNSDGASNGLTAPNGPSQQRVIRQALANAGLRPTDVDAVEAHGTGTRLGDPIEAQALLATYGQDRPADRPLLLGSVKSNLGHTQAAAGVAGVIKMVLAMRHGMLPATLHVDAPSGHVDWSSGAVRLLTETRDWAAEDGRVRRAGVSSFGISGTNAHVIVEEAPAAPGTASSPVAVTALPWVLSGRSPEALTAQARALAGFVAGRPELDVAAVARALVSTRAALEHRAVVVGADREELLAGLAAVEPAGAAGPADGGVVLVFPGQGAQWLGMAAELLTESPVFAARIAECAAALAPYVDWSLLDVLESADDSWLRRVDVVQPALWAVMVSLAEVWRTFGVDIAGVVGHSQGEIAAAVVAGILSLADGARVVAVRSAALRAIAGTGGMLAVAADPAAAAALIEGVAGVSVAATNGPASVVLSGDVAGVDAVEARCAEQGVWCRRVPVDYASHSAHVDSLRAELLAAFDGLTPRAGTVPFHSTVTGARVDPAELDAAYWFENLRRPVRFDEVVTGLIAAGHRTFVEASPHPVLTAGIGERGGAAVGSLRRGEGGLARMLRSAGDLWTLGGPVDWRVATGDGPVGELPTYAFQRQRFWLEPYGPLLGEPISLAGAGALWNGTLSTAALPWLADHAVLGQTLLPGAAFAEIALQAVPGLGELTLQAPLVLPAGGDVAIQVIVEDGAFRIASRAPDGASWTVHATGTVAEPAAPDDAGPLGWPPAGADELDLGDFYDERAAAGYGYGPAFRGLRRAWRAGDDTYAEVELPAEATAGLDRFGLHPALLDAALHAALLAFDSTVLPFVWSGVRLYATGATRLRARISPVDADTVAVSLADAGGAPVAEIDALTFRPVSSTALTTATTAVRDALFEVRWTPSDAPAAAPAGTVLRAGGPLRERLAEVLTAIQDHVEGDHAEPLVVVTNGAVPVGGPVTDPAGAAVWGLVRSAQTEHPGRLLLVDTDGDLGGQPLPADEPQIALRDGVAHVPRLTRATVTAAEETPATGGTVLVTGGTGVLGALVAERLVTVHGVRRLVLTSRRGPAAPDAAELVERLTALGAEATVVACDAADRAALAAVTAGVDLTGVVHCAGILDDGVLTAMTADRLDRVLGPKADAALHLHELTAGTELDFFVLFSSVAATLGTAGQANYAAANGFLDGLASLRRGQGLAGTSVGWGLWAETSAMTGQLTGRDVSRLGGALSTEDGMALFDAVLRSGPAHAVAARIDTRGDSVPALLRGLVRQPARRAAATAASPTFTADDPAERRRRLLDLVRAEAAAVLGHASPAAVDPDRVHVDLGFESLTAVELRNRLARATGLSLPATLVFTYPTPNAVADYLAERLGAPAAQPARAASPAVTAADEPIAIIGMSCRYPGGVTGPDELWRLVADGGDAVTPFPANRGWDTDALYDPDPDRPGTTYATEGGFLHDADAFDAEFFGISPREALAMDPQQRILLETAWEAFESAGIDARTVRGTRAGVFTGVMYHDYQTLLAASDTPDLDGYAAIGVAGGVASGRVAYTFGLEGPAVTVDTACSSSLVAVHLAAEALRRGECTTALAGGVTVMATPGTFVDFSRQRGLAPDGRCKSFAAAADGTGWSEGAGLLVLERLSDARRNGHRILAVVRGSAVNQDGASNGLTAPNGLSQQRLIAAALAAAGLEPGDVDAVEAHGTGTTLGDPIEAEAIIAAYGRNRPADRPLRLGSLKSNIGHSQAAAGVGGIIKMVLAMRHGILPRTLHVDEPTPHVDWAGGAVELLREACAWPETGRARRAGVSSFGISGTNAHVVLEAPPAADTVEPVLPAGPAPLVLSAPGAAAVRAQVARIRGFLAGRPELEPARVGAALVGSRVVFDHRAVLIDDVTETGVVEPGALAFLFAGQGAQRVGMGAGLVARFPVFAEVFEGVVARFDGLREALDSEAIHRTVHTQAGLFAVEVALFRLLESWGVAPDYLLGHSIGEIAAAHVAGVMSLDDAVTLVAARGRLMQALPAGGAMLAVRASEESVREIIAGTGVDVAAVNGPTSVVISGPADAVDELAPRFAKATRLTVSHAFHSSLMEPMLAEFAAAIGHIEFGVPRVPVVSNLTGVPVQEFTVDYWVRHVREAVRFDDGMTWLAEHGVTRCLEVGPAGVLSALAAPELTCVAALRRDRDEASTLLAAVGRLWTLGVPVDWSAVLPPAGHVDLPTYPFQRLSYWPAPSTATPATRHAPGEARFWDAVDRGDLAQLAGDLDVTPDTIDSVLPALAAWRRDQRSTTVVDGLRYRESWVPLSLPPARLTGRWLAVAAAHPPVGDVLDALRDQGADVLDVVVSAPEDLTERLTDLDAGHLDGVVLLTGLAEERLSDRPAVPSGLALTVTGIQALAAAGIDAPVWCLTRGAVSVGRSDPLRADVQAAVWGLARVAAIEQPVTFGGVVDLPEVVDERAGQRLAAVLAAGTEDQAAVRGSGAFGRRLVRAPAPTGTPPRPAPTGTVLVTGGTGALGAHVARRLAAHGVPRLLLLSRRGPDAPGATELVAELADLGSDATVVAADAGDRDALASVLAAIPADRPLTGVVHAAGVVDDATFLSLTVAQLDAALRSKAVAAEHLDELTRDLPLDMFVLFSSFAGSVGNAGQAGYAAANARLDAIAARRRAAGLPATAVAWGPWATGDPAAGGAGMAAGEVGERLRRLGLSPVPVPAALDALDTALRCQDTAIVVADVDWTRFAPTRPSASTSLLAEPPTATAAPADLTTLGAADRRRALLDLVRARTAAVLRHPMPDAIEPGRAFHDMGFDSLTAIELRNTLAADSGLRLPLTLVFDHPTPAALADHLAALLGGETDDPVEAAQPVADADDPIVVTSMACRFPGGVRTPEDLWALVRDGVDGLTEPPTDRGWRPGTGFVGGFLADAADFDAALFGVSPREALAMDPQQRLLLESVWETFERAGIDPRSVHGARIGVFAGTNGQDYPAVLAAAGGADVESHTATGNAAAILSGRVSYAFGLEGPAVTVDTACSSSLVAMHLAAQAIRAGECHAALAAGVTVMSTPGAFDEFDRQGGLAPDGRCKAFADAADGTGWGEGVGVLLLERLSAAREHGREPLAVLRGSAVNQDGASNGLTAPNGPSQQRVIRQALANAGLSPADVDAVEAHGTGTKLGDPIEAQALLATYGQDRPEDRPVWLGSVKSNIGHTQAAAGVAGAIKMVLAMRHGVLPATLHVDAPTGRVDWSAGAVRVLTEAREWDSPGRARRAGVSSFGLSGTNAHVILEQATAAPAAAAPAPAGPVAWAFSAKTDGGLRGQARRLAGYATSADPSDVARALAGARATLEHRAVVVADTAERFAADLAEPSSLISGVASPGGSAFLFTGQGAQRIGMGAGLYARFPVFAAAFDGICARFDQLLDVPLRDAIDSDAIHRTVYTQAGLFAVEVALFRLVESWGVIPDFLLGHSIGEIAAAHVAGVMSLDDAVTLVAARGRLMQALPAGGAMLAVRASEAEVRGQLIDGVDVAAVNGPTSVVVSGPEEKIDELAPRFAKATRLTVSHAFHSSLMEPMLADFAAAIGHISFAPPRIPVVSNLTGEPVEEFTADYWVRHVREAVRFDDGMSWLAGHGVTRCLEIGPAGVLSATAAPDLTYVPALRKDRDEVTTLLEAAGRLWTTGVPVDWTAVVGRPERTLDLPTYAFDRTRFWPATPPRDGDTPRFHAEAWVPLAEPTVAPAGTWLLVLPDGVDCADIVAAFPAARTVTVDDTAGRAEFTALLASATDAGPLRVLSLLGLDTTPHPGQPDVPAGLASTVALAHAVTGLPGPAKLWCLTRNAVATGAADGPVNAVQAHLWGLGRVAAMELPQHWGGLVDVPPDLDETDRRRLAAALAAADEDQLALRPAGLLARRLRRTDPPAGAVEPVIPTGTVLVTGGTGALGAHAARWLAARGVPHLLLLSRRGPDAPGAADLVGELTAAGATVTVRACDVASRTDLAAAIDAIPAEHPLDGVVHTAGVTADSPLETLTLDQLAAVLHAKTLPAAHLDALTAGRPLRMFVLYSSMAGAVGNPGQANYAAANSYLDALAGDRHARGLPATALAWGPWADGGLAAGPALADRHRGFGLRPLAAGPAMAAFGLAVAGDRPALVVGDVDWTAFAAATGPNRLLAELTDPPATGDAGSASPADQLRARLATATDRDRVILDLVRAETAAVLRHRDRDRIDPASSFRDLGFDSLLAVELRNRLGAAAGLPLPATLVFDHPTPAALAAYLMPQVAGEPERPTVASEIDRLEAVLFGVAPDEDERDGITARLRALLDKWSRTNAAPEPGDDLDAGLDLATADEMLELIQREFGSPT